VRSGRRPRLRRAACAAAIVLAAALPLAGPALGSGSTARIVPAATAVFDALPNYGAVGHAVGVFPFSDCPAPADASQWIAIVSFAQGGNSQISYRNYVVNAAGNWGGYFTIPIGAVPGAAQLTASCFDPSHTSPSTFDYAPVPFTVVQSTFGAAASGPVGAPINVHDVGPCPAPAGASSWTALVRFGQGANPDISSQNYTVDGAGAWSGDFTVPYGVVPGPAQLTATCFDASHASQVALDYVAVPFTVTVPSFTATPASNAVGGVFTVSGDSPCPAPAGASAWVAIVRFGQGANAEISYQDYAVGPTGAWSGQFTVPAGTVAGPAQLTASCFDPTHTSQTTLDYAPTAFAVTVDTTPPVLHLPARTTVNATSRAGAVVRFAASASDTQDPNPKVSCAPSSGSTFAIGASTVTCTASDLAGNVTPGHFTVNVLGAGAQVSALVRRVKADHLRPSVASGLVADLSAATAALAAHSKPHTCSAMGAFIRAVRAATGHGIPVREAAILAGAAARIRAVIGC
jgi:hypothetical protein